MDRWLINGQPGNAVPVNDRGLHYGDGLFETIAVRDGSCRFQAAHFERLLSGCKQLGIPLPDTQQLDAEIAELMGEDRTGTLKIIVTRGTGKRGYAPPETPAPLRLIGFTPDAASTSQQGSIKVRVCTTRLGRNAALAGLKTLNRLEQVLARSEWDAEQSGIAEGLMLNDLDQVVCGTMSNLFVVLNGELITPPLTEAGVAGVMRTQVMKAAKSLSLNVKEQIVNRADLAAAKGVFLTNALTGMRVVTEIDGQSCQQDSLTKRLRAKLAEAGVEECRS